MKSKEKRKGFTLIELLATIVIVSLVFVSTTFLVKNLIDKSNKDSREITLKSIKESALTYTKEYKTDDTYWFDDSETTDIKYACTTVGMLINKGILKSEEVIGVKLDDDTPISTATSVKITRDANSKVFNNEDIAFNDPDCYDNYYTPSAGDDDDETLPDDGSETPSGDGKFDVGFSVDGTEGENGWYVSAITIKVNVTGDTDGLVLTGVNGMSYEYGSGIKTTGPVTDKGVTLSDNVKNMDLVINIPTTKDNILKYSFCEVTTGSSDGCIKIDTEPPTGLELNLKLNNSKKYYLLGNNAKDNFTAEKDIKYTISSIADETANGSITHNFADDVRYEDQKVVITVADEAGNKSSITKNLNITDAKNTTAEGTTKHFCSLDTSKEYSSAEEATTACSKTAEPENKSYYQCSLDTSKNYETQELAKNNCTERGTVTEKVYYSCSLGGGSWSYSTAKNSCYETEYGTVSTKYFCDGKQSTSSKCTVSTTVSGGITYSLVCSNGVWKSQSNTGTTKGCGDYELDYYECAGCSLCGFPCSGTTDTDFGACTNHCSKTYSATVKYYCSITGGEVSSAKSCYTTYSGTVYDDYYYYCSYNSNKSYSSYNSAYSACTNTGTVSTVNVYYCSLTNKTYEKESDAISACSQKGTTSSKTKYYCSLTDKTYDDETSATTACTNYCSIGTYNNNACYGLN